MAELPAILDTALRGVRSGSVTVTLGARSHRFGGAEPALAVRWSDAASRRIATSGLIGLGDAWVAREWDVVDGSLLELLRLLARDGIHRRVKAQTMLRYRAVERVLAAVDRLGRAARHRAVRSHYDRGADFFALWLDPSMTYTCGIATSPTDDLATMQHNKLRLVCEKLRLGPGESLLDLGCGFGSLALHAAREHGTSVTAVNIARDQLAWLRARVGSEGLGERITVVESDWRDVRGRWDKVAAIGLAEHAGRRGLPTLMRRIRGCMHDAGVAVVQSIGSADEPGIDPWIERRVFPGADVPVLSELVAAAERAELRCCHVESLGEHYALTLRHWLAGFLASEPEIRLRWGDAVARTWHFYLASLVATFEYLSTTLYQLVLSAGVGPSPSWPARGVRLAW